jgi:hypothetical protein
LTAGTIGVATTADRDNRIAIENPYTNVGGISKLATNTTIEAGIEDATGVAFTSACGTKATTVYASKKGLF